MALPKSSPCTLRVRLLAATTMKGHFYWSYEMKQIMTAIAGILLAAAKDRAECVLRTQAEARKSHDEEYRSNAGGWN
jgi:hypothetical protein